jgi:hypothetical protein
VILVHAADVYQPSDPHLVRRLCFAQETWRHEDLEWGHHRLDQGVRSSVDLGSPRRLPYIRDVINHAIGVGAVAASPSSSPHRTEYVFASPNFGVLLTNSDICLPPETVPLVRDLLKYHPCWCSHRAEVDGPIKAPLGLNQLHGLPVCVGWDLFAMTAEWWTDKAADFPDVFCGAEGWDFVLSRMMLADNPGAALPLPICYHERHEAAWSRPGVIDADPAQAHNRRLCREWAVAHGLQSHLGDGQFLFR